jgi:DNA-binding NarL/FixJ family response regulator
MTNAQGQRARVALIDDDAVLATLVQTLLGEEGFQVVVCANWLEAHAFVLAEQPALVLLDVRLGDSDYGWRVLDHLSLDPTTRHTPVILWSGAHEALRARAPALLPEHGVFVITKPFDLDMLLGTVEKALTACPPVIRLNAPRAATGTIAASDLSRLTRREHEVARLIARGYTNRQIADALVLTPGTVANHVAHILGKLECSSRVQIAICAHTGPSRNPANAEDCDGPNRRLA